MTVHRVTHKSSGKKNRRHGREPISNKVAYKTSHGSMYWGLAEDILASRQFRRYRGKIRLIFTSPPFPLNRKKSYGNRQGEEYRAWLGSFPNQFRELLTR